MNDSLIYIAADLKNAPKVDHYRLCSKNYNDAFLKAAQALDLDRLEEKGHLFNGRYFYTYKVIKDMSNNRVGMHLLGMSAQQAVAATEKSKSATMTMVIIAVSSFVLVLLFLLLLLKGRK